jgi:hypothetical protein
MSADQVRSRISVIGDKTGVHFASAQFAAAVLTEQVALETGTPLLQA